MGDKRKIITLPINSTAWELICAVYRALTTHVERDAWHKATWGHEESFSVVRQKAEALGFSLLSGEEKRSGPCENCSPDMGCYNGEAPCAFVAECAAKRVPYFRHAPPSVDTVGFHVNGEGLLILEHGEQNVVLSRGQSSDIAFSILKRQGLFRISGG